MRGWILLGANWGQRLGRARVPRTRAKRNNFDVVSEPLERQRVREGAQGWGHGGETHSEDTPQLRHGFPRCCLCHAATPEPDRPGPLAPGGQGLAQRGGTAQRDSLRPGGCVCWEPANEAPWIH